MLAGATHIFAGWRPRRRVQHHLADDGAFDRSEARLLLAIAKPAPSARDVEVAEQLIRGAHLSWPIALGLAARCGDVGPILAHNLEHLPSLRSVTPPAVRSSLTHAFTRVARRRTLYIEALAPVVARLDGDGIPCALMKGAALAETLYPMGTRPLSDVDLLIPESAFAATIGTLEACGFRRVVRVRQSEGPWNSNETLLVKGSGPDSVAIDLHWEMCHRDYPFRVSTGDLLSRARTVLADGLSIRVMSPEDTFVNVATQIFHDGLRVTLRRAGDLYGLAGSTLSWADVSDVAAGAGAAGMTYLACRLAALLGARIPDWVFERLASQCPGCRVPADFLARERWVTDPSALRNVARPTLHALLSEGDHLRVVRPLAVLWRSYRNARTVGKDALSSMAVASCTSVLVPAWSAALLGMLGAEALGASGVAARIRSVLWKRPEATWMSRAAGSRAPERVVSRE
jgi:hypothetical protein